VVFVPTARYAAFGSIPVVTMVRNMEPLTVPFGGNPWTEGLKNLARAWEARRACRRATRVIAVSNHVRDYLVSRWGIDASRVGTVHHGVDQREPAASFPGGRQVSVLFTAGSIRPARGLEDAIRALALVDPGLKLVIGGRVDAGCERYAEQLRRMAETLGVSARITWRGDLTAAEMEQAFLSSAAFVMTSRAEACPNIALEAMSTGCPSIAVDHAPMPEIFGDAAVYYRAGDARALADRIRALMGNAAERERLAAAATKRAGTFTWAATCDRTIRELERSVS
jgi:glycosyltransferase involved in cell wall biosynthesis